MVIIGFLAAWVLISGAICMGFSRWMNMDRGVVQE